MNRILIVFAHPNFGISKINKALVEYVPQSENVTFHDLYQLYPDFKIDVETEQQLLSEHDVIILQHPFYWYSSPPLLKQWIDSVFLHGWAYGTNGNALAGKFLLNALTSGGSIETYSHLGRNRYTLKELLTPFDQTSFLCKMIYLPPFAIQGTYMLTEVQINDAAKKYRALIDKLSISEFIATEIQKYDLINHWI